MAHFSTPFSIASAWGGGWPFWTACAPPVFAGCVLLLLGGRSKGASGHLAFFTSGPWHHRLSGFSRFLRAHTAAIGTAAAARTACSTTHPSTKSGIQSNSRVITSDAHFGIKPCFCYFPPPPPDTRVWPAPTASPLINCLDVYGRGSLWVRTCWAVGCVAVRWLGVLPRLGFRVWAGRCCEKAG